MPLVPVYNVQCHEFGTVTQGGISSERKLSTEEDGTQESRRAGVWPRILASGCFSVLPV